jgi:glycogen phosphorylase
MESKFMMKSINFRMGMSMSLLRTVRTPMPTTIPRSSNPISLPQSVQKKRDRWLRDTELVPIETPNHTSSSDFNLYQWLSSGNPRLARLVTEAIGDRWTAHIEDLQQLTLIADDLPFQSRWRAIKQANKQVLANKLYRLQGIKLNVNSLFDLQLQPIGGHQRQLLNILHVITLFDRLKQNPALEILPRTFIFGDLDQTPTAEIAVDTALSSQRDRNCCCHADAPTADKTDHGHSIRLLIQSLAKVLAADPDVNSKLQVVYVPKSANLLNQLYAAADLTEQISTAAIEDTDLTTLRATINGVISIGSLGKTNYWLQQAVGEQNCFRFGLAIPEIALFKEYGYDPYNYYKYYPQIRHAIDYLLIGHFTPDDPDQCRSLVNSLLGTDEHMVLADHIFYTACQARVSELYHQPSVWTKMSILNVAGVR